MITCSGVYPAWGLRRDIAQTAGSTKTIEDNRGNMILSLGQDTSLGLVPSPSDPGSQQGDEVGHCKLQTRANLATPNLL